MKKLFQMKNLKLLNKKYLSIILFYLFFGNLGQSQEPIDIWNIEEKNTTKNIDILDGEASFVSKNTLKNRKASMHA